MAASQSLKTSSDSMIYQALARKWRPRNFSQLVGQEHVTRSLLHALRQARLHHAYLFTGTRGVGKTTVARILAKALNCSDLNDGDPCNECMSCQAIDQGKFIDLIEIDAASRTRVEDTRELLDNVQYAPGQGRYKVYLIDEVHMLSGHSFNALLKTLEEPPPHVKFLLATTDPQKIPVTVLSRCLQFNLKRMLPDQIVRQMCTILQQEGIDYDEAAIVVLARAADGSMRDGLSMLDQAIAFGGGRVNHADVVDMLGGVDGKAVEEILAALSALDGQAVLAKVEALAAFTPNFNELLQQIVRALHRVALVQYMPDIEVTEFDPEFVRELATKISPEDVQLYYQIALMGQSQLPLAPEPRAGFEMVMLRMLAFRPVAGQDEPRDLLPPRREPVAAAPDQPPAKPAPQPPRQAENGAAPEWGTIVDSLKLRGLSLQLASHCLLTRLDEHVCHLIIDPAHENLISVKTKSKLHEALQAYCGKPIKLQISVQKNDNETPAIRQQRDQADRQQAAEDAINADENILALKQQFGARVLPGSVKPNDE